ncbi:glycoside hydrolase family 15 protein [Methylosinus sp. KRF6]|uniref:glycoside hydrolase family 15 protein n=1 Tax=Methylosinus sp. KRF6 TaxID=2846853 RepID=UPI001C0E1430|nr:glycoside hydrolase family 15 protein [Methylosinus sp. KRF6]MBU3887875.1 glycoside hydrolase family 15 protein [Methylosinus sp. KRF6]
MAARIEDYAMIGDCETAALVARDGSIDWLCWPRFDSGACFAALIGSRENGRWRVGAADPNARISRRYRKDTLILETDIETSRGEATIIDFMPPSANASDVVRLVVGKRGVLPVDVELVIRFDYGSLVPWITRFEEGALLAVAGPDLVVLRTPAPLRADGLAHKAAFDISAGETVPFVLSYGPSHLPAPDAIDPFAALVDAETFWRCWTASANAIGEWQEAVTRSLITLKALTYRPTGGIVSAVTTSLPERLGGGRNWDYRFCWLRDATFTLLSLMNAGYFEEARAWRAWLLRAVAGAPEQAQIMYGLNGERRLQEWEAPWLCGYEDSRPVRIGNAACSQLQLDIYGETIDALYHARRGKLRADAAGWALQCAFLAHLEQTWRDPDHGVWEMRSGPRQFTLSKVMAWVAFDRAIKTAEIFGEQGPLDRWRAVRREIHEEVCRRGFDGEVGAFVQSYGSKRLDASLLLAPLVGFLPAADPRMRSTVAAIERRLLRDGLVMRYDSGDGDDGLAEGEGAFLACSFWLVDNLALLGRTEDARSLFERLLALRNDVGLLSEEVDAGSKRMLGNFPQALSHIALINSAHNLGMAEKPAHQRSSS